MGTSGLSGLNQRYGNWWSNDNQPWSSWTLIELFVPPRWAGASQFCASTCFWFEENTSRKQKTDVEHDFGTNYSEPSGDCIYIYVYIHRCTTVDGRNPAPPECRKNLANIGINYLPTGAGFLPSTVAVSV